MRKYLTADWWLGLIPTPGYAIAAPWAFVVILLVSNFNVRNHNTYLGEVSIPRLRTELNVAKAQNAALEAELVEESEQLSRLKAKEDARADDLEKRMRNPGPLVCQTRMIEWAARVEGAAGLPELTLKRITEYEKGFGSEPDLSTNDKRRLLAAVDQHPPPKCSSR